MVKRRDTVIVPGGETDRDGPVTIYLPLDPGSQSETWDISLPKLYNVKAMV